MVEKDIDRILVELLKNSRENREMILKIEKRQRQSRNFRVAYWIVIIGILALGYYVLYPYLSVVKSEFSTITSAVSSLGIGNSRAK